MRLYFIHVANERYLFSFMEYYIKNAVFVCFKIKVYCSYSSKLYFLYKVLRLHVRHAFVFSLIADVSLTCLM